ncbi:hypothetical protein TWF696_006924 [Orbilia brochopaga]|uniref:Uncharacterized protein n=1 Tax=Orbilia brochopaga TaxID=3140254 RepID=A0AAV9UQQ6_9PEZI
MLFSKNLVAGLAVALSLLVQDAVAATPSCCTNQCGKAVGLNKNGKKDCSAVLIKTVILPTATTTRYATVTHTLIRHGLKVITPSTALIATATLIETDTSISTSISTDIETAYSTDITTVIETEFSTTTVPFPVPTSTNTVTVIKKRTLCATKPAYARTCDNGAYTRACSCVGVKPYTVTKPAPRKTITKTRTAYATVRTTATSIAPAITATTIVTVTSFTTVISGTEIVETSTVTLGTEIATTVTTVSVATHTADPVLPGCVGLGFTIRISTPDGSVPNNWGLGWITSLGLTTTTYIRGYSGGASQMTVDETGSIRNWWPNDMKMVVRTDGAPYQVLFSSDASNIHYSYPTQPARCGVNTDGTLACKVGEVDYQATMCRDPQYYDWILWLYNDEAQLAGRTCVNSLKAACKLA